MKIPSGFHLDKIRGMRLAERGTFNSHQQIQNLDKTYKSVDEGYVACIVTCPLSEKIFTILYANDS